MTSETIGVRRPHHYWLATREDMLWLVDPDVDDGRQRHDDRELRDWESIGRDVAAIGELIATAMDASGPDDDDAEDVVTYQAAVANPMDRWIVESWFEGAGRSPSGDPGDDALIDGRHRLWATWTAVPSLLLPVQSSVLMMADDMHIDAAYAAAIAADAERVLRAMSQALRERNPRYVAALESVAREAQDLAG